MSNELMLDTSYNNFKLSIEQLSETRLEKYANEQANAIVQRIEVCSDKIRRAKRKAEEANDIDTSWGFGNFFGGKTKKKVNALGEAQIATNEALAETQNLIQATIQYSKCSVMFARQLNQAMAAIMVRGFESTDGRLIRLTEDSKESVSLICSELEDFVSTNMRRDAEIKKLQDETRDFNQVKSIVAENKEALEEYKEAAAASSRDISRNRENIEANRRNIDSNRAAIAENRESIASNKEAIAENRESITSNKEAIEANKELIQKNEKNIQELSIQILENAKTITKINEELLKGISSTKVTCIAISSISLLVSIASIVMHFVK